MVPSPNMAGPPEKLPRTEVIETALEAVYSWNYEPELDQLRTLYANALEAQWIAVRDLDWESEVDQEAFARTFTMGGIPIQETAFWWSLPAETRWQVASRSARVSLSNFLHGEQGALFVASQLVNAVPHMDGKLYAATQTVDEARHVEVFSAYLRRIGGIEPVAPLLKKLLDDLAAAPSWMTKAVGMNIVLEGLALYTFRVMRNTTQEPLLKTLLTFVSRDEARHTGFGIKYLSHVVGTLERRVCDELEDFAFESARLILDARKGLTMRDTLLEIWREAGIDPDDVSEALSRERDTIRTSLEKTQSRGGPLGAFVLPTLASIGLLSDRIRAHFDDMYRHNSRSGRGLADRMQELPEDLEAWVMQGA